MGLSIKHLFQSAKADGVDPTLVQPSNWNATHQIVFDSPLSSRNRVLNGDFHINQRIYASAATLAAGKYGHDMWRAGASGGNYSFTQLKSDTLITIASGKTLQQPIEDRNIEGGSYMLSWAGTAQARVGVSGASPSGSYAASPITLTTVPAGQQVTLEFNSGTLGKVQLEPGTDVTPFERIDYGAMVMRVRRYCYGWVSTGNYDVVAYATVTSSSTAYFHMIFPVEMYSNPTFSNPFGSFGFGQYLNEGSNNQAGTSITSVGAGYGYNEQSKSALLTVNGLTGITVGNHGYAMAYNSVGALILFEANLP